ncbi:hypothetical protein B0H14DRAFT_1649716 [Mycena olivaceomarginata]|nr:hypothetical protein B0H14DRAFT_1649716 [Mycena olivaceomarginata]
MSDRDAEEVECRARGRALRAQARAEARAARRPFLAKVRKAAHPQSPLGPPTLPRSCRTRRRGSSTPSRRSSTGACSQSGRCCCMHLCSCATSSPKPSRPCSPSVRTATPAVRRMVITMIPTLSSYNTPAFTDLHKAMAHLSQLSSSSFFNSSSSTFSSSSPAPFQSFSSGEGSGTAERDYALIAIGQTATVGAEMKPFLESVMSYITARHKDVAAAAQA